MPGQSLLSAAAPAKVLVCTDDSPDSHGAVGAALALARLSQCRLYLLQVLEFIPGFEYQPFEGMMLPPQMSLELLTIRETAARTHMSPWQEEAAQEGLSLELRVRNSATVYAGILEEIEELQPDLLIMGRHGRTGLDRLMMGSVTARVIGHSPVKVLVVPKGVGLDFQRILIAHDGSSYSEAAWQETLAIAQKMGSALVAVSVARDESALPRVRDIVGKMAAAAGALGVPIEPLALSGRPYEAIPKTAREQQVNLIVMGSHGRTGLKRLLMGSVVERVIGQAPCAVLVVK